MLSSAALFLPLVAMSQLAAAAGSKGSFEARITIVSECSTQQALFGPQAQNNVTVICQPSMTPFQTQSIDLDDADSDAGPTQSGSSSGAGGTGGLRYQAQGQGTAAFSFSTKNELSPPLPSAATFASKVIYVVF